MVQNLLNGGRPPGLYASITTAMPDLETAILRLRDLIEDARRIVPVHWGRHSTECGIPDFRSPGGLWTETSQSVRRLHDERRHAPTRPGGGVRHGREFRQGQAGPGAPGAGEPLSCRQGAGAGDAKYRQSASGLRHRPDDVARVARQTPPMRRASSATGATNWLGARTVRHRRRACAGLRLRRPHQDRDRVVRPGNAGCCDAAGRALGARLRSVSRHRLVASGLAGRRSSADGQSAMARRLSSSIASRPSSTTSPIGVHHEIGDVLGPFIATLIRSPLLCIVCAQCILPFRRLRPGVILNPQTR